MQGGNRGMQGGNRGRMGGNRRGAAPPTTSLASLSDGAQYRIELTQMGGRRGGNMGGNRSGGPRGNMGGNRGNVSTGRTRGSLPPLGSSGASNTNPTFLDKLSANTMVNNQNISLSRDCILTYNGIAFTLHDMRVIRIHVSE